jgi:hypothetical protein
MLRDQGMSATIAYFKAKKRAGEEREQLTRMRLGSPVLGESNRMPGGYTATPLEAPEKTGGYGDCWNDLISLTKEVSHREDGKVHSDYEDADHRADDSNERGLRHTQGGVEGA